VEYFEVRDAFEEAKKAAQVQRTTKALRVKLANAFWELKGAAEKLEIPTRVSKTDEL
jgi:transcription initiation factor TFIIIB Brf1 subunit/transcription initiation factor TFIIB